MASLERDQDGIELDPHHVESHEQPRRMSTEENMDEIENLSDESSDGSDDSGSSRHRVAAEDMIGEDDRSELVRVATTLSRRRSSVAVPTRAITQLSAVDENDPALDPGGEQFDLYKWLRRFVKQLGEEGVNPRSTGVAYRNLDVYGSGAAVQIQQTLGSTLMALFRPGEFFSFGKKEPKQILHGFNGSIKGGDLLVVLGRPGSGCSTLLKSLCGELHGLRLGENARIDYNGVEQKQMMKEFKGEAIYNQEVGCNDKPAVQGFGIDSRLETLALTGVIFLGGQAFPALDRCADPRIRCVCPHPVPSNPRYAAGRILPIHCSRGHGSLRSQPHQQHKGRQRLRARRVRWREEACQHS